MQELRETNYFYSINTLKPTLFALTKVWMRRNVTMSLMMTMTTRSSRLRREGKQSTQVVLFSNLNPDFMTRSSFCLTSTLCILPSFRNTTFASPQSNDERLRISMELHYDLKEWRQVKKSKLKRMSPFQSAEKMFKLRSCHRFSRCLWNEERLWEIWSSPSMIRTNCSNLTSNKRHSSWLPTQCMDASASVHPDSMLQPLQL